MKKLIWIGALFLGARLLFLNSLPIFNDEAMYLHWGQELAKRFELWFLPLVIDGKQPGMPVILGMVTRLAFDPLLSGRILNVAISIITFIAVYLVSAMFNKQLGIALTLALLSVCPFVLQYDRMVMMETAVMAAHSATLALLLKYASRGQLFWVVAAGLASAAGWWFKTTSLLTVIAGVGALLVIPGKTIPARLTAVITYFSVFYLSTLPLRLHPAYANIGLRETERVLTTKSLAEFPWGLWWSNSSQALLFLLIYLTPLVALYSVAGFVKLVKIAPGRLVLVFAFTPILIEILVSKIFTSRYLVLVAPVFVISAAYYVTLVRQKIYRYVAAFTMFILPVLFSIFLTVNPIIYYRMLGIMPPVQDDFGQYVRGWSSGYGVREAINLVKSEAAGKNTAVFVRADSGNPEDAVFAYLAKEPFFNVYYVNEINRIIPTLLVNDPELELFFISRGSQLAGLEEIISEIGVFWHPLSPGDFVGVYRINIPDRRQLLSLDWGPVNPYNITTMNG